MQGNRGSNKKVGSNDRQVRELVGGDRAGRRLHTHKASTAGY